jgi:hypothetical protein
MGSMSTPGPLSPDVLGTPEGLAHPFPASRAFSLLFTALLLVSGTSQAQPQRGPGEPVDAAARAKRVERVSAVLNETYVFPEVARKMEAALRQKLKAGAYDKLTHSAEFAEALTRDLREVSKDKHLSILYAPTAPPGLDPKAPKDAAAASWSPSTSASRRWSDSRGTWATWTCAASSARSRRGRPPSPR